MKSADEELIERIKGDDPEALELLVRKYIPRVYNWVRVSVPESDIEDVVQDIFCSLKSAIDRFKEQSSFYTYLYKITRFEIIDYYRSSKRYITEPFEDGSECNTCVQDSHERISNRDTVGALLRHLSEEESRIITMRFMEGYSFGEIASAGGLSYEAVRSKFRRALEKINRYKMK